MNTFAEHFYTAIATAFLIAVTFGAASASIADCNRFGHLCEPAQKQAKPKLDNKSYAKHKKKYRTAVIVRGLFGEFLAPMHGIRADLERRGFRVRMASFYAADTGNADMVVGHSMGCFAVDSAPAKAKVYIDCPIWAHGAFSARKKKTRAVNFYTAMHPRVPGAVNVPIASDHISAPRVARPYIRHAM